MSESLLDIIMSKRSIRKFQQKAISDKSFENIINAARNAPSAANFQPLKFAVVKNAQTVSEIFGFTKWAGYLPPEVGTPKPDERPVAFIAVFCDRQIGSDKWYEVDCGLSVAYMTLAAWNEGIASCIIGACDRPEICKTLNIPENLELKYVIAFGYPAQSSAITDECGSIKYTMNDDGSISVPKRKTEDTVKFF